MQSVTHCPVSLGSSAQFARLEIGLLKTAKAGNTRNLCKDTKESQKITLEIIQAQSVYISLDANLIDSTDNNYSRDSGCRAIFFSPAAFFSL